VRQKFVTAKPGSIKLGRGEKSPANKEVHPQRGEKNPKTRAGKSRTVKKNSKENFKKRVHTPIPEIWSWNKRSGLGAEKRRRGEGRCQGISATASSRQGELRSAFPQHLK